MGVLAVGQVAGHDRRCAAEERELRGQHARVPHRHELGDPRLTLIDQDLYRIAPVRRRLPAGKRLARHGLADLPAGRPALLPAAGFGLSHVAPLSSRHSLGPGATTSRVLNLRGDVIPVSMNAVSWVCQQEPHKRTGRCHTRTCGPPRITGPRCPGPAAPGTRRVPKAGRRFPCADARGAVRGPPPRPRTRHRSHRVRM